LRDGEVTVGHEVSCEEMYHYANYIYSDVLIITISFCHGSMPLKVGLG